MSQETVLVLGVGGFISFFVGLYAISSRIKGKRRQAFQVFADQYRLEVEHGNFPKLQGKIDGRAFTMGYDQLRHASGRRQLGVASRVALFFVRLGLNGPLPEGLLVTKRGLIEKALKSDVTTGDPEFDSKAFVRCANPATAKAYLTADRRATLLGLLPQKITLQDGELAYGPGSGEQATFEYLEQMSKPFRDAAKVLDSSADASFSTTAEPVLVMNLDEPGTMATPAAVGTGLDASRPTTHRAAATWMGVTALVLYYLPSLLAGYFRLSVSMHMLLTVVATAAVAFGASKFFESRIESGAGRGAAIGATSWLVGTLASSLFAWGLGSQIASWFSMSGLLLIVLSAVSGVLMAKVLRQRG